VACNTIYNCGATMNRCPNFGNGAGQVTLNEFLFGSGNDGCIAGCANNPLIVNLVDPNDCDVTIANLKAANAEFAMSCDP
jgi:hypothetical protein